MARQSPHQRQSPDQHAHAHELGTVFSNSRDLLLSPRGGGGGEADDGAGLANSSSICVSSGAGYLGGLAEVGSEQKWRDDGNATGLHHAQAALSGGAGRRAKLGTYLDVHMV
jgi:hypothetical protein